MRFFRVSLVSSFFVAGLIGYVGVCPAAEVHTFQVGAFASEKDAYQKLESLPGDVSPAWVQLIGGESAFPWRVCIGHYEIYSDAWAESIFLDDDVIPEFVIRTFDVPEVQINSLPIEYPISTEGMEVSFNFVPDIAMYESDDVVDYSQPLVRLLKIGIQLEQEEKSGAVAESISKSKAVQERLIDEPLLKKAFEARKSTVAVPIYDELLASNPDSVTERVAKVGKVVWLMSRSDFEAVEPELEVLVASGDSEIRDIAEYYSGYFDSMQGDSKNAVKHFRKVERSKTAPDEIRFDARIRLAYLANKEGDEKRAVSGFENIASDKAMPRNIRLEAMQRLAGIYHRMGDKARSWVIHKQIESVSNDPDMIAESCKQRVGLAMELAQSGKGKMEEVSFFADKLSKVENIPEDVLATNNLMHAESLFHRGQFDEAIKATDALITDFPDFHREFNMACVLKAACLIEKGDHDAALPILKSVAGSEPAPEEKKFKKANSRAMALKWMAHSCSVTGDHEGADKVVGEMVRRFPETTEARTMKRMFPGHPLLEDSRESPREILHQPKNNEQ